MQPAEGHPAGWPPLYSDAALGAGAAAAIIRRILSWRPLPTNVYDSI